MHILAKICETKVEVIVNNLILTCKNADISLEHIFVDPDILKG